MTPRVEFVAASPRWRTALPARSLARETIAVAASESGVALTSGAELCIHLADDERIRALNARWRGLDQPTNVLSFPAAAPAEIAKARLLGDVVLAFETLAREAADQGTPLADHYRHLVAHGFLHLIGFDHDSEADAERMEAIETRVLARLGVADPYRAGEAADARP
jgi:probable rRNA maturation factor